MIRDIAALTVGLICVAGRLALKRDESTLEGADAVHAVLEETGTSRWGWDGAAISDYYLNESMFV